MYQFLRPTYIHICNKKKKKNQNTYMYALHTHKNDITFPRKTAQQVDTEEMVKINK